MTTPTRTLAILALTCTAAVVPIASTARGEGDDIAAEVRAFEDEKRQEIDEAIANLRLLIAEKARTITAMESDLRDAEAGLARLQAIKVALDPAPVPAAPAPASIPGTLDAVVPASATAIARDWGGTIRVTSSAGGRLDLLHESGDGSGAVQAGALQGDLIEIRVSSEQDARVVAEALRIDGKPVVSWPDLRILPESSTQPERIEALERTIHRLAEAVDRLDRRTPSPDLPPPAPGGDDALGAIPAAPTIPD